MTALRSHVRHYVRFNAVVMSAVMSAVGCFSTRTAPLPRFAYQLDTARIQRVSRGVEHLYLYAPSGPWAIHALRVDRRRCYSVLARKGASGAIGRTKTSAIMAALLDTMRVVGGVNADFFLFTPPGVPQGAYVTRGRVITGPSQQPVFAIDSSGEPRLLTLASQGELRIGDKSVWVAGWNRRVADGIAMFDGNWAPATDTASATTEIAVNAAGRVVAVDTLVSGIAIPPAGMVLAGRGAAGSVLRSLSIGDSVGIHMRLTPIHPMEAVGGRPMLLRDSAVLAGVDSLGGPGFATTRHPRTAIGVSGDRRILWFVVVDGRQKPYSDGMTSRELANLLLALGARDAINLDGGGSTTLVYADPDSSGRLRIANRPSDATGERAVGNALAVVRGC